MLDHLISEVDYGWALRISAFLILALLIIGGQIARSTDPQAFEIVPVPQAIDRDPLFTYDNRILLVLLGSVLANQLHPGAVDGVWNVHKPRILHDPYFECCKVYKPSIIVQRSS